MADEKDTASASQDAEQPKTEEQIWADYQAAERGEATDQGEDDAGDAADRGGDEGESESEGSDADRDGGAGDDDQPSSKDASGSDDRASDPWAALPPELRKQFVDLENRAKAAEGRLRSLTQSRRATPNASPSGDAKSSEERKAALQRAREEYGDVLEPVLEEMAAMQAKMDAFEQADQAERASILEAEAAAFLEKHPDGFAFIEQHGDEFKKWANSKDRTVAEVEAMEVNSDQVVDAEAASRVLQAFRAHIEGEKPPAPQADSNPLDARRKRQMEGARSARSSSAPRTSEPGGNESPDEIWKYYQNRDRKREREGSRF